MMQVNWQGALIETNIFFKPRIFDQPAETATQSNIEGDYWKP